MEEIVDAALRANQAPDAPERFIQQLSAVQDILLELQSSSKFLMS